MKSLSRSAVLVLALFAVSMFAGCGSGSNGVVTSPSSNSASSAKKAFQFNIYSSLNKSKRAAKAARSTVHIKGGSEPDATQEMVQGMLLSSAVSSSVTLYESANGTQLPTMYFPVDAQGNVKATMDVPAGSYTLSVTGVDVNSNNIFYNTGISTVNVGVENTVTNPATANIVIQLCPVNVSFAISGIPGPFNKASGNLYTVDTTGGFEAEDSADGMFSPDGVLHSTILVDVTDLPCGFFAGVADDLGAYYLQFLSVDCQAMLNAIFYGKELQYSYKPGGTLTVGVTR